MEIEPNTYKVFHNAAKYLEKHQSSKLFFNSQQVKKPQTQQASGQLRQVYEQFQNGKINPNQLKEKIIELNYRPNEEWSTFIKSGDQGFSKLIRCVSPRNAQLVYNPSKKMNSFSDRKLTYCETEPSKGSSRRARIQKHIQDFQAGKIDAKNFTSKLQEEQIDMNPSIQKAIDKQALVGASHKQLDKCILSQLRSQPQQITTESIMSLNQYKYKIKDMEQSTQQYCETHILIHGATGATVGKRADVLTKFYKGTPDLLSGKKIGQVDEVNVLRKGSGIKRKEMFLHTENIISPKPAYQSSITSSKKAGKKPNISNNGDIISWERSNLDQKIGVEDYHYLKNINFTTRR